jgi:uncharacterized membrane protein
MKTNTWLGRILWVVVVLLVLIGVFAVVRRTALLTGSITPQRFSEGADMDAGFNQHPLLTMVHIIPGLLFMILGPFQFVRSLRARRPKLHRWVGRLFVLVGIIVGVTALMMGPQMAIGGVNETVATMLFALIFLFALGKAWLHIRRREISLHREWMIRAFAIGLAVATIRPIVGVFFATRLLTHLTPQQFFGTAFWLGFTLHLIAAETWINLTRNPIPAKQNVP